MQIAYEPQPLGQTLLIDADDTLWENNVYFERAIADFISFVNHQEFTPAQVRQALNDVEREHVLTHGYGLHSFREALLATFQRVSVEPLTPGVRETICGFAHTIAEQPIELIEEVEGTLRYLQPRHQLILMTKGCVAEQSRKLDRSGLKQYFTAVEIVAEKDPPTYGGVIEKHGLEPETTWMIGNSPKSDINSALAAGLNAIFVPHSDTWILEHEAIAPASHPARLLHLDRFAELRTIF